MFSTSVLYNRLNFSQNNMRKVGQIPPKDIKFED